VPVTLLALRLKPVYADIGPDTLNLDATEVSRRIRPRTKAILFQHTYGTDCGILRVAKTAAGYGLPLIEDCAQCMPYASGDHRPGRVGLAAIFSCNLMKPLPAGAGGFLATDDDDLAQRVRQARNGLPERSPRKAAQLRAATWLSRLVLGPRTYWPALSTSRFISSLAGERGLDAEIRTQFRDLAYRPTAFQLREGIEWMSRLEAIADHRQVCCADYGNTLAGEPRSATPIPGTRPLFYFPILTAQKPALLAEARRQHLQLVAWPGSTPIYPVERMGELSKYDYEPGTCPVAESVARQLVGLPTDIEMTAGLRRRLVTLVRSS
jgi:dTDP-4-amino-4,6-dideoxygalactose transaminase